ncbi:hypothetical protein [Roseomonas sp. WA12]
MSGDPQHEEAVPGVVVGDPLHQPGRAAVGLETGAGAYMRERWCLPAFRASMTRGAEPELLRPLLRHYRDLFLTHLAYIDSSNLFIEAQKVSAVARGMARSLHDARQRGILDFEYRLDLYRLMALLTWAEAPVRAVLFGSTTDTNEGVWRHAAPATGRGTGVSTTGG